MPNHRRIAAFTEHAIFSGLNFSLILFASHLLPDAYLGELVTSAATAMLAVNLCIGMWSQPFQVLSAGRRNASAGYFWATLFLTAGFSGLVGSVSASLSTLYLGGALNWPAIAATTSLAVTWSCYDLVRRASYTAGLPGVALSGTFAGGLLWIASILALPGMLSTSSGLIIAFSLAQLASSLGVASVLRPRWGQLAVRDVLKEHWTMGKWGLLGLGSYWWYTAGLFVVAAAFLTPTSISGVRVAQTLTGLAMILSSTYESMSMPRLARAANEGGWGAASAIAKSHYRNLPVPFLLLVLLFTGLAYATFRLIYPQDLAPYAAFIPVFAFQQVFWASSRPLSILFRAIEKPEILALAHLIAACCMGLAILPAVLLAGEIGLILTLTAAPAVLGTVLFLFMRGESQRLATEVGILSNRMEGENADLPL